MIDFWISRTKILPNTKRMKPFYKVQSTLKELKSVNKSLTIKTLDFKRGLSKLKRKNKKVKVVKKERKKMGPKVGMASLAIFWS